MHLSPTHLSLMRMRSKKHEVIFQTMSFFQFFVKLKEPVLAVSRLAFLSGRHLQRFDLRFNSQLASRRKRKWPRRLAIASVTLIFGYYSYKYLERITRPSFPNEKKKKVVILGSGWGAMTLLNHLNPGQFEISVVSPRNYFLFTPILPSVTVGTVESRSIVEPIRKIIRKSHKNDNVQFYEAECVDVLHKDKKVHCKDMSGIQGIVSDFKLDYDILITAVGADNNTFNVPGAIENCYFLKEMEDAKRIRDAIIDLVESACYPGQPIDELNRLLHFVVVGGGPTGVEFASELRDFLREDIPKIYDDLIKEHFKVTLIQSGDHILNTYDQQISKFTERNFKKTDNNVDVMTSTRVISVDADKITLRDKSTKEVWSVPYGMCVWSTGVAPRKLTQTMMANIQNETRGRALLTDGYLRVIGADGIFALGDCSTIQQTKMIAQAEELFESADVNKDGKLCLDEFKALMEEAKYKCPQVQTFLSCAQRNVEKLFAEHDVSGDQRLDINEFKHVLATLDKQLKSLPATAQVASQQGEYLGELLSKTNGNELLTESEEVLDSRGLHKFKYRHLGSFAYVGDNQAVLEIPIFGALSGWWVMWLWRAAYTSECASTRTKFLLITDWIKSYIFGRDTSRI